MDLRVLMLAMTCSAALTFAKSTDEELAEKFTSYRMSYLYNIYKKLGTETTLAKYAVAICAEFGDISVPASKEEGFLEALIETGLGNYKSNLNYQSYLGSMIYEFSNDFSRGRIGLIAILRTAQGLGDIGSSCTSAERKMRTP